MTAPMQGHRARLEIEKYFGAANVLTTLVDYRKYFYARPATFAVRLYNYGMYGKEAEDGVITPFYLGYPWLVRGYENVRYNRAEAEQNQIRRIMAVRNKDSGWKRRAENPVYGT